VFATTGAAVGTAATARAALVVATTAGVVATGAAVANVAAAEDAEDSDAAARALLGWVDALRDWTTLYATTPATAASAHPRTSTIAIFNERRFRLLDSSQALETSAQV